MRRHSHRIKALAFCLSAVAGYIDALGFLELNGLFVSFMSGNSTRFSIGLTRDGALALSAGGLIVTFVLGVVLGSLAGAASHKRQSAVLGLVALLLLCSAACGVTGNHTMALAGMALAMGAVNTVFSRDGEVSIGVTYMTGTLVKLGQHLAAALMGGPRFAFIPYLLLWSGLILGAFAGALAHPHLGFHALWIAATAVAILSVAAGRITHLPE